MNSTRAPLADEASVLILALAGFLMTGLFARAQGVQHLSITQPGGMPGMPVTTGIERVTNGFKVTWDGPSGYYQLYQKLGINDPRWQPVGGPNLTRSATVPAISSNAFFRVSGPSPQYAGALSCRECHGNIYATEANTRHPHALDTLKLIHQEQNPACLPCHTVGYGLPSGFVSETATPQLAGVQCENCHGPAGNHAANENDPIVRPRVELAATVCGGCHSGPQVPTYDEWTTSGHAAVVPDALAVMNSSTNSLSGCGRCHSGSVRVSLLKKEPLPVGDANVPIVCAVCHDPHQTNGYPAQLRNPVASTNNYYLTTSTNFASAYRTNINICGQCHNHRGAAWTDTDSPPHRSPQYNMLLGNVGELASGAPPSQPGSHALWITNQCVGCHMQTKPFQSESQPANTGHSFGVDTYDFCRGCHPLPEELTQFTMTSISNQIQQVKLDLDFWASVKAPMQLWTNYGVRSWEYTTPGELSPGGPGPNTTEQLDLIPVNIRRARFNLYLLLYDGSYGVHNVLYGVTLLETARGWIQAELSK